MHTNIGSSGLIGKAMRGEMKNVGSNPAFLSYEIRQSNGEIELLCAKKQLLGSYGIYTSLPSIYGYSLWE